MNSILERLNTNFIIASFIPSLAFTLVATLIFDPIIPQPVKDRFPITFASAEEASTQVFTLFALILIIGFTLANLNTFIYKIAEGYFILNRLPFIRDRHKKKAQYLFYRIKVTEKILNHCRQAQVPREKRLPLEVHLLKLKTQYQLNYHPNYKMALPTRFGNIFRSAESYSGDRYKIDSIITWPRLIHVIPPSYFSKLEQSNSGLAFLINCMTLSGFLSVACFLASGYQFLMHQLALKEVEKLLYFIDITKEDVAIYLERGWIYFVLATLLVGSTFIFYNATLPAVRQYGGLIRSSFDLFRFDLAKQLHSKLPVDSEEEKDFWMKWSEFVAIGSLAGDTMSPFEYVHQPVEDTNQDNSLMGE